MTWKVFCEINRGLFALPTKPWTVTFWKLAASVVTLAGLIAAYYHAPDAAAHQLINMLVTFPALKSDDAIGMWDHGNHTMLRAAASILLLGLVYGGAFAAAAQEHMDYRTQLARRLGIRFLNVRRDHEILNLDGDCRTASVEEFAVGGIFLSHVDRYLQLTTNTNWGAQPGITLEGLPDGTNWSYDVQDRNSKRGCILNFVPALHETAKTVQLRIAEAVPKAFFMYDEETQVHAVFDSRVETISWFVIEPIECLELSVTFPHDYRVRGQSQFSVRYKSTRTTHADEERRLRDGGAITSQVSNAKQTLKLKVEQPVIGLQYYLFWETPKRPAQKP